ncbi:hypothetical protein PsYK624_078400 [Phanerochaete sordida]|uniref:VIT-domain-containing protein n=1 Tax=Phanerochaete sordida TaxID=48140 RepID=A0A9P3LDX1_9APHY|nr:hypothetical protein PsYK624_078400 [Phanerochaete sordida]
MQLPTSATSQPCGIRHEQSDETAAYLPLERAEVHAEVVDVSAIITITQHFWQYAPDGLERTKYVFPVPARAAVCAFKLIAADGTVIAAVAKEKEQAKREHDAAIAQGHMTGLVEHVTDDVFSISLGALPGQQMITTEITYVLDLMDDDIMDSIRLQIPMYVGMRYGELPEGMQGAHQAPPERVTISADVRMQGAVRSITSPTHPTLLLTDGAAHAPHRAAHRSAGFLTQDFVLAIAADGLDAPRCFAQRARSGATALQLSVVPRFALPPVPQQEYVFLVDRSGSMEGGRIAMAKRALVMLLRALPAQGTRVNIFSFGSRCDSLWESSVLYDERTLREATEYVDKIQADYGGTEILSALNHTFASREMSTPTACFVLTDGESYDTERVFAAVKEAVEKASPGAPLRVFTLGIGDMTSTATCEGIARAGDGICLMATTSDSIVGKCSKLVRASKTYILRNISIDWGVRTDPAQASAEGTTEQKTLLQAPAEVAAIYPGNRFVVFALIEDEAYTSPKEVVIRAQRDGQGEVLAFSVPVQTAEVPADHLRPPLIPTLAARRAIMDLEDRARPECPPDVKEAVIRLGTAYQLASRFTSFVAVDRRTDIEIAGDPRRAPKRASRVGRFLDCEAEVDDDSYEECDAAEVGSATYSAPSPIAMAAYDPQEYEVEVSDDDMGFGCFDDGPSPPSKSRVLRASAMDSEAEESDDEMGFGLFDDGPAPAMSRFLRAGAADSSAEESDDDMGFGVFDGGSYTPMHTSIASEDKAFALIRLQSFDGSFAPTPEFLAIIGEELLAEAAGLQVDTKVWATVLAVAFLKKHLKDGPELLDDLVEKAMGFVDGTPDAFHALIARAQALIV